MLIIISNDAPSRRVLISPTFLPHNLKFIRALIKIFQNTLRYFSSANNFPYLPEEKSRTIKHVQLLIPLNGWQFVRIIEGQSDFPGWQGQEKEFNGWSRFHERLRSLKSSSRRISKAEDTLQLLSDVRPTIHPFNLIFPFLFLSGLRTWVSQDFYFTLFLGGFEVLYSKAQFLIFLLSKNKDRYPPDRLPIVEYWSRLSNK